MASIAGCCNVVSSKRFRTLPITLRSFPEFLTPWPRHVQRNGQLLAFSDVDGKPSRMWQRPAGSRPASIPANAAFRAIAAPRSSSVSDSPVEEVGEWQASPSGDYRVLTARRSMFNAIVVLEFKELEGPVVDSDDPAVVLSGSRIMLLDESSNVSSIYYK